MPRTYRTGPRYAGFQADDWNRNQRGGGVDPADMKHRIEDQAGKGYAGKVGTGLDYRRQRPKARGSVRAMPKREQGRTQPPSRSA
jgi:hypothetical protein